MIGFVTATDIYIYLFEIILICAGPPPHPMASPKAVGPPYEYLYRPLRDPARIHVRAIIGPPAKPH